MTPTAKATTATGTATDTASDSVTATAAETTAPEAADDAGGLGRAAAIVGAATLAASVANYGLNLALARWLTPARFGDANLIVTILLGLTAVALTMQLLAAQRLSGQGWSVAEVRTAMLRRAWGIGAAISLTAAIASPLLRELTSSESALPFAILAIGIPLFLAQAVERGVLQGQQRFGALAATLLAEAGARLGVSLALVIAGFGVTGAAVGITVSFLVSWLVAIGYVDRSGANSHSRRTGRSGSAVDRAASSAAATLLVGQILVNNGDVVLAKVLFDPDDAGVHAVVALVGRAIFFLSWSVVTAAFPASAASAGGAVERQALRLVIAMSVGLTAGAALLAPVLSPIVFGAGYDEAATLFFPYAIATSLFSIANVRASLATARGDARPARIVVIAGVMQALVLAAAATDLASMTWLQVAVMAGLLVAVELNARRRVDERHIEPRPDPVS